MSKIKNIAIVLITFAIILLASSSTLAATLSEVKYSNSKITVSGTCTTSNQIQVILFDLNKKPMYFATVDVENNAFNKTLDTSFNLEEGKTYTVKIADYNGTGVSSSTFTVKNEVVDPVVTVTDEKDDTPKTGI